MAHFKPDTYVAFVALCLLLIGLAGCNPATQDLPETVQGENRDDLIGWYQGPYNSVIPIFKYNGAYYSVFRGVEVPFKPSGEGLTSSDLNGTTIGRWGQSDKYFISLYDEQRAAIDERFIPGQKLAMTKIEKPSGLFDTTSPAPKKIDDFLGWYVPAWLPGVKIEISKVGQSYFSTDHEFRESGKWVTMEPKKLTVLNDPLGFKAGREQDVLQIPAVLIIYNKALKRFEITLGTSDLVRMPLARIRPNEKIPEPVKIGIPIWN